MIIALIILLLLFLLPDLYIWLTHLRPNYSWGWQLLMNEHRTLRRNSDSIHIVGVETLDR